MPEELEEIEIQDEAGGEPEEIEIVDDAPDGERQPPAKLTPVEEPSASIRKSINRLTRQRSEAIRALGETQREKNEAIEFAKRAHAQLKFEQAERVKAQTAWQREAAARREAEIRTNKGEFVTARELNDAAKEADVNAAIAKLTSEKSEIERWAPTAQPIPEVPDFTSNYATVEAVEPNSETMEWAESNEWFATEEHADMRAFAVAMEGSLAQRGYTPGTKKCYDALDAELRKAFPDRFSDAAQSSGRPPAAPARKAASPVLGATRTNGTRPSNGKMTLTASQVAVAKALGISPVAYWKQLQSEKNNG